MLTGEHRVAPPLEVRGLGQIDQQRQRFAGDPVLAVVDVEITHGKGELAAAVGILGEELAEVFAGDLVVMATQRVPFRAGGDVCGHSENPSAAR